MKRVLFAVVAAAAVAGLATPAAAQDANRGGWSCFAELNFAEQYANYKFTRVGKVNISGGGAGAIGNFISSSAPAAFGSQSPDGPGGGVGLGCDWHRGNWVLGAQLQHTSGTVGGTNVITALPTWTMSAKLLSLENITARVGYMVAPDFMAYVRTGFGVAFNSYNANIGTSTQEYGSTRNIGFVLGGGLEYNINNDWSVYGEYTYNGFGTYPLAFVQTAGVTGVADYVRIRQDVNQLQIGVHYHF